MAADPQRADSPTRDPKFLQRLYRQFTDALPYLQEATMVIRTAGLDLAGVAEALLSRVAPEASAHPSSAGAQ